MAPRAINAGLAELKKWVLEDQCRMKNFVSGGAAPTQADTNDVTIGVRIDYGPRYEQSNKKFEKF